MECQNKSRLQSCDVRYKHLEKYKNLKVENATACKVFNTISLNILNITKNTARL